MRCTGTLLNLIKSVEIKCTMQKNVNVKQNGQMNTHGLNITITKCTVNCVLNMSVSQSEELSCSFVSGSTSFHNATLNRNILVLLLSIANNTHYQKISWFGLQCLMSLSTIFQLYCGSQFYWLKKPVYLEKTTDKSLTNFIT